MDLEFENSDLDFGASDYDTDYSSDYSSDASGASDLELIKYDEASVQEAKAELDKLWQSFMDDVSSVIGALKTIQVNGTLKDTVTESINSLQGVVDQLQLPDTIGKMLENVSTTLGMNEKLAQNLFGGFGEALTGMAEAVKIAASGIKEAVTTQYSAEEVANYNLGSLISDSAKNAAQSVGNYAQYASKFVSNLNGGGSALGAATNILTTAKNFVVGGLGKLTSFVQNTMSGGGQTRVASLVSKWFS